MDDFNISSLHEAKNEWAMRLITILTPLIFNDISKLYHSCSKMES